MIFSLSFLGTSQAQVWRDYRQNPRTEARLKNGLVFLLNNTMAYLGLTLVVSFQTQGLGPGFRPALPQEQGAWNWDRRWRGWVLFSARRNVRSGGIFKHLIQNGKGGT